MPYKKIEKFYLRGIKALIFLIPFISFYISTSIVFPYITGKNFAFRILVEAAAVLWSGLIVLNKEYRLQNSTMVLSILIFTFIVGLADLSGVNPYNSFWSNYERMEGYITILHLALYFMIIKSILRTKKDWKIFFNIFAVVSVFVSLYAFIMPSAATGISIYAARVSSTIGNPPFLASYLLFAVFLVLILSFNTEKPYLRLIYLLTVTLHLIVIYFTATRGAILSAIAGMVIFSLLFILIKSNTPKQKLFKKVVLVFLGAVIFLSAVFLTFSDTAFLDQDKTLSRFETIFSDESVKSRVRAWGLAWEGIKERPILGWGQENFIGVYSINPIPYGKTAWSWMDRAHNIVLDWLINAGFAGLSSYILIFCSAFYCLRKAYNENIIAKSEAVTIATALSVYFIQNLFTFDTINTYLIFFTLLAYIDNFDSVEKTLSLKVNIDPKKLKIKFVGITVFTLLFFSTAIYFINYKPIRVSQFSNQISTSSRIYRSFSTLFEYYNKALSFKTFGDSDITLKMHIVSRHTFDRKLFMQEGALKFIQMTAEEMEKLVAANRYNLKYWTFLIGFYNRIALFDPSFITKTEALIKKCMQINPEYQWLYYALADNYILKKNYGNVISLEPETEGDPQNDTVQLKLSLGGILTSREDIVNKAMEDVKKIRMSQDDDISSGRKPVFSVDELLVFAQASTEIENFNRALQFYKEVINISPENAEFHFDIAKIYLNIGDRENAGEEAYKAVELDPLNYSEKVKNFIDLLN